MRLPIYLDYMATTPVDTRVAATMQGYLSYDGIFANPASMHVYGQQAHVAVEEARQQVASLINASADEMIWTSGATEANNLALKGAALFYQRQGKHIVTCQTEHKAVLAPCRYLESLGFSVTYLQPNAEGLLDIGQVERALQPDTILISIMHVNNEIGVIQDIAAIGELARQRGILLHVDAAQSAGKIAIDVKKMQIDLLSLTAHKFYGPKGVGALFVRGKPRLHLIPQLHGGEQEHNLRSGTLAVAQIIGMGEACRIAQQEMLAEQQRLLAWRQLFWHEMQLLGNAFVNGSLEQRIAGNLNFGFSDLTGESLLSELGDIAVSTGAACRSLAFEPSHVLLALGLSRQLAANSLRFSFGRFTTEEEVYYAIQYMKNVVNKLRTAKFAKY